MVSKESRKVGASLLSQICSNYFTARHQGITILGPPLSRAQGKGLYVCGRSAVLSSL